MIWLGLVAVLACIVGSAVAFGYALGHSHGAAAQASVEWEETRRLQRRHKRCTPEPVRLRLVDYRHPAFFDQDGPTPA